MPIRPVAKPAPIPMPRVRVRAVPGVPPSPPNSIATFAFDMHVEDATALYTTATASLIQRGSSPSHAAAQLTANGTVDVGACIRVIMNTAVVTLADLSGCPVSEPAVYLEPSTSRPGYGTDDGTGR